MCKKHLNRELLLLLTLSLSTFSASIGITLNTNAVIKATPSSGGSTSSVNATDGVEATVEMTWSGTGQQANYDFEIIPDNPRYADSSFTKSIGQWWNDPIKIDLKLKELPMDTAFIPIRSNVDITIKATAIEMIKGGTPTEVLEFVLPAKTADTIMLPVETNLVVPITQTFSTSSSKILFKEVNNKVELTLPLNYLNGSISVTSMSGRKVGYIELTSNSKNSLSVWNVSNGIYALSVNGKMEVVVHIKSTIKVEECSLVLSLVIHIYQIIPETPVRKIILINQELLLQHTVLI